MKTPTWESSPGALATLINSKKFNTCDLITISWNSSDEFRPHKIASTDIFDPQPGFAFSRDSSEIFYLFSTFIKTVGVDGLGPATILDLSTVGPGVEPTGGLTASPLADKIAFSGFDGTHDGIYTANSDGSGVTRILYDTADDGIFGMLSWGSNDKIAFTKFSDGNIYRIDANGANLTQITSSPPFPAFGARWSPDATKLVFGGVDNHNLWIVNANGSGAAALTTFSGAYAVTNAGWSTDGLKILFGANSDTNNILSHPGVWSMNPDGTNQHKFLTTFNMSTPTAVQMSPDGKWIAYMTTGNVDTSFEGIWIFRVPEPLRIRENLTAGTDPDTVFLTDCDTNVRLYAGGPEWNSRSVRIDKEKSQSTAHWGRGMDVDSWVLVLAPRDIDLGTGTPNPDTIRGLSWIEAAQRGLFNGADVEILRAYFPSWPAYAPVISPTGVLTIFAGNVAEADIVDQLVVLTSNDCRGLLSAPVPKSIFSAPCSHTLFDSGCTLQAANFAISGSLIGGSTRALLLTTTIVPGGSGTFNLGKIKMTSGLNAGFSRTISNWTAPNSVGLLAPLPFAVAPGDTFLAYPGCNKTKAACDAFGNGDNFDGFPDIPDSAAAF